MSACTLLGFGGRAPSVVLALLQTLVVDAAVVGEIRPEQSQALEFALLQAPSRLFLQGNASDKDAAMAEANDKQKAATPLLIYCLPTSFCEYARGAAAAAHVRTQLLQTDAAVVVLVDVLQNEIMGADMVVSALAGDAAARRSLTAVAWQALAALDGDAAQQLQSSSAGDTIIVVGGGGREHALAVALAASPLVGQVWVTPGNGGTATEPGGKIRNIPGGTQETAHVVALTKEYGAQMVVVGPEAPLVDGLVDRLAVECPDVLCFGPTQAAAELEASKAFSKDFLQEHGIPTAKYRNFTNVDEALAYVDSLDEADRQVVKASGLAAGKGVLLPTTKAETRAAVQEIMADKAFGTAGDTCVIESFLLGPEASCLAFCDGKTAKLMPAAQDHKRALDHDEGLNTGGMGAYAPAPCVTPALQAQIEAMCCLTVEKMAARGTPYVGCLYAGMMLTPNGPYVLEFNCRFGDPETQVVLPLLETDLYEVMKACCTGTLDTVDVRFKEDTSAATVVCAALGYPEAYPKGMEITGLGPAHETPGVKVYHAGTRIDETAITRCSGGRVLAVTGVGTTLQSALRTAYKGVDQLGFVGSAGESLLHRRTDIGRKALRKKLRIGVLGSTRGTALLPVMEACAQGNIEAEIVAVVSNKASAPILEKGTSLGPTVVTKFIAAKGLSRAQYDAECTAALVGAGVEYILLVGYMRILSKPFTDFWKGRCINVHPSLLPKHAGGMDLAVHQAVIDAGERETGCTIHEVTETVDGGPVVVQQRVSVEPGETAESLKAKVQPLEGPAFVQAIATYIKQGQVIKYSDAGVSIDTGNRLIDVIKPYCKATRRAGCDADLGGFGGLFDLAAAGYNASETVLIGATDGVGTKLRIAHATGKHESVGIDLVAMCVNDLIVAGGEPLFFLDYFATGKLEIAEAAAVVKGIAKGCELAACGLIGGETAEMPSMYAPGDYDLAGFSVGAVQRGKILPSGVTAGDVLLGLSSSGIHSNGFSLVRKLLEKEGLTYESPCPWDPQSPTVGDSLLTPTKIYVKSCLPLIKEGIVKGMAHITGGGLLENLPRSLPQGVGAHVTNHPPLPPVFRWLQQASGLDDTEMLRTFNCGIGMVLIVAPDKAERAKALAQASGETAVELGKLIAGYSTVLVDGSL
jgi:phosphoribosylamine--glycine ligase/phosphoribosylglycinamide formyltransferase/phosphoribosylformylglycinamidine cyclo-ligase/phosphoribosylamine--glycine ligase/phosphoribosylformylglycinamidine cyclo-ligase